MKLNIMIADDRRIIIRMSKHQRGWLATIIKRPFRPIILCSKGIGSNYLNRSDSKRNAFNKEETIETYTTRTSHKINLPTYYRNKLYTDDEKEMLWMNKLQLS